MSDINTAGLSQPVTPCHVTLVDEDGLVVSMVSDSLEKDSASEQRDLQSLDVDVHAVLVPGPCSNSVGNQGGEEAIEVEEEEEGQDAADDELDEEDPIEVMSQRQRRGGQTPTGARHFPGSIGVLQLVAAHGGRLPRGGSGGFPTFHARRLAS